jgi:hypothetical protein
MQSVEDFSGITRLYDEECGRRFEIGDCVKAGATI